MSLSSAPGDVKLRIVEFVGDSPQTFSPLGAVSHEFYNITRSTWLWSVFTPSNPYNVKDSGIAAMLRAIPSDATPRAIDLRGCLWLGDAGLSAIIERCTRLEDLRVDGTLTFKVRKVTDTSVRLLSSCQSLKVLWLCRISYMSDESLEAVFSAQAVQSTLEELNLRNNTELRGTFLRHVAECVHLRSLDLQGCFRIDNNEIVALENLRSPLEQLSLSGLIGLNSHTFASVLRNMRFVRHLEISGCRLIDDQGVSCIPQYCPALTHLDMKGCGRVTDLGVEAVLTAIGTQLEHLAFSRCRLCTPRALELVGAHANQGVLRELEVADMHAEDASIVSLLQQGVGTGLRKLDVGSSVAQLFGVEALMEIAAQCPRLEVLDVSGCGAADEAVISLLTMPALRSLDIRGSTGVNNLKQCYESALNSTRVREILAPRASLVDPEGDSSDLSDMGLKIVLEG